MTSEDQCWQLGAVILAPEPPASSGPFRFRWFNLVDATSVRNDAKRSTDGEIYAGIANEFSTRTRASAICAIQASIPILLSGNRCARMYARIVTSSACAIVSGLSGKDGEFGRL